MIPCQEDSCLKFSVCRHNITIFCTDLYNYLEDVKNEEEVYSIFYMLIDCYRDRYEGQKYMDKVRDGAPIFNSKRLMDKIEKDNTNEPRTSTLHKMS